MLSKPPKFYFAAACWCCGYSNTFPIGYILWITKHVLVINLWINYASSFCARRNVFVCRIASKLSAVLVESISKRRWAEIKAASQKRPEKKSGRRKAFRFCDIFHDTVKGMGRGRISLSRSRSHKDEHDERKVTRKLLSSSFNRRRKFIRNLTKRREKHSMRRERRQKENLMENYRYANLRLMTVSFYCNCEWMIEKVSFPPWNPFSSPLVDSWDWCDLMISVVNFCSSISRGISQFSIIEHETLSELYSFGSLRRRQSLVYQKTFVDKFST